MTTSEILESISAVLCAILAPILIWATLGCIGVATNSHDSLTRSFCRACIAVGLVEEVR